MTGYTAAILEKDGIIFEQFCLNCARAFGACVMLRDEPMDAPIPDEFTPSDYHKRALAEAQAKLTALNNMTLSERVEYGQEKQKAAVQQRQELIESAKKAARKLILMKAKVLAWEPPSSDHVGLKNFMLEQIDSTLQFDGRADGYTDEIKNLEMRPFEQFFRDSVEEAQNSIAYHIEQDREELERTHSRTAWIQDLRNSLKQKEISK
jgi:hypothetical protein